MTLYDVVDATWPAAATHRVGPWLIRDGQGGGKRVSSATAEGEWAEADIDLAEAQHRDLGQTPLFMIRDGETRLDAALDARGYTLVDPVNIYAVPTAQLATTPPPPITTFCLWPMLEIMREIWAEGDIGPGRIAVMDRVAGPKTAILGRVNDRAAGVAFVAKSGSTAMLHALHVVPEQRRHGVAVQIMRAAAFWAQDVGAQEFAVVVTRHNPAANPLYTSLGMRIVGHYHYRMR